jgi:hypothetical protein
MSAKGSLVAGSSLGGRGPKTLAIAFALASVLLVIGVTFRSRPQRNRCHPRPDRRA